MESHVLVAERQINLGLSAVVLPSPKENVPAQAKLSCEDWVLGEPKQGVEGSKMKAHECD